MTSKRIQRLVLWDVDATLLSTGGVGGEVMRAAMAEVFGATTRRERTFYSGKTDRQIILETFSDLSEQQLADQLEVFKAAYVAAFERRRPDIIARTHTLPGVREALHAGHTHVWQAPLTGNIAPIARLKLDVVGLLDYLEHRAGGYGDDHHDRAMLVPIALERARAVFGQPFAPQQVVVVGDTPNDIRCAHSNGARAVAVATGPYRLAELEAHAPDAALPDLRDTTAVLAAILA